MVGYMWFCHFPVLTVPSLAFPAPHVALWLIKVQLVVSIPGKSYPPAFTPSAGSAAVMGMTFLVMC